MEELKVLDVLELPKCPNREIIYRLLPVSPDKNYYSNRTDRNYGWISREEQRILNDSVVGISGCGGMGGLIASTLLRTGVGEIRIADPEVFDSTNINRQFAASRSAVGLPKAFETARLLREITNDTTIVVYPQGICEQTVRHFVSGNSAICDEIEFWQIAPRILLHRIAREFGVNVFNCNTVGFRTNLFRFEPDGFRMEDLLGLEYESAVELTRRQLLGDIKKEETEDVMRRLIRGLVPGIPCYASASHNEHTDLSMVMERLRRDGSASIIGTNPPMASGFLCNRVILHLLRNSDMKRESVSVTPAMPAYLFFDALRMTSGIVNERWW